jgi:peptide-methionine (R)-S-oxide reductase
MALRALFLAAMAIVLAAAVPCESFVGRPSPSERRPISLADNKVSSETIKSKDEKTTVEEGSVKMKTYNPLRLLVLKAGFTEPMYTSPLNYEKRQGIYSCAFCGHALFDSSSKYDSRSGWPSFWRSALEGSISYKREFDGRLECQCGKCKSHLGHVFPDGPKPSESFVSDNLVASMPESDPKAVQRLPRFCINGASLRFEASE